MDAGLWSDGAHAKNKVDKEDQPSSSWSKLALDKWARVD